MSCNDSPAQRAEMSHGTTQKDTFYVIWTPAFQCRIFGLYVSFTGIFSYKIYIIYIYKSFDPSVIFTSSAHITLIGTGHLSRGGIKWVNCGPQLFARPTQDRVKLSLL